MKPKTIAFTILILLILWFLYIQRTILTPFVVAAIFAYIFNPLIDFFSHKLKFPRTGSIISVYIIIIGVFLYTVILLTSRVLSESSELAIKIRSFLENTQSQAANLPDWLSPTVNEGIYSIQRSHLFSPTWVIAQFPAALERVVSVLIFLFASYYFLKEGRKMIDQLLHLFPSNERINIEILIKKSNAVLSGYLRGQLFMVVLVAAILFLCLSILGVRYSLLLAVFAGIAEIVPIIGPITATVVAMLVVFLSGSTFSFGLDPVQAAVAVLIIFTVVRQGQDYFITPHIMGRITKLHPLVILFSVLAGGHIAGILGVLLAVPVAAIIRIIFFEYLYDKYFLK